MMEWQDLKDLRRPTHYAAEILRQING